MKKNRIVVNCHSQKELRFMEKWTIKGLFKFRKRRRNEKSFKN
jgi:hypothetical protein